MRLQEYRPDRRKDRHRRGPSTPTDFEETPRFACYHQCSSGPPSSRRRAPISAPAPMLCAKPRCVARAKHAKHGRNRCPCFARNPGVSLAQNRQSMGETGAGARALRETPVCRSRKTCKAWTVDRADVAHQAEGKNTGHACMRPPRARPTAPSWASAPMVATKPRRVARGNHGNHGKHGRSSGGRRPPVGPRRPGRWPSGTSSPAGPDAAVADEPAHLAALNGAPARRLGATLASGASASPASAPPGQPAGLRDRPRVSAPGCGDSADGPGCPDRTGRSANSRPEARRRCGTGLLGPR
jgi:hypothetical protein